MVDWSFLFEAHEGPGLGRQNPAFLEVHTRRAGDRGQDQENPPDQWLDRTGGARLQGRHNGGRRRPTPSPPPQREAPPTPHPPTSSPALTPRPPRRDTAAGIPP